MQVNLNSHLNSSIKSNFNTDGRTDERDEDQLAVISQVTAVDAGARPDGPVTLHAALDYLLSVDTRQRHQIVRTGERDPIPMHVRAAVWLRDRGRCEMCGWLRVEGPWHLDHIVPWSAGGPDTTDNLRVLCERHNLDRSNFRDVHERPRQLVTWWCLSCYGPNDAEKWDYWPTNALACKTHRVDVHLGWKGCPVARGYHFHREATGEWPDWHRRAGMVDATILAYCAHCQVPGLTDVTL